MATYLYEGKHYALQEGLTNDQAIDEIEAHLGMAPKVAAAPPISAEPPSMASLIPGQDRPGPPVAADPPRGMSAVERVMGSPTGRFFRGAIVDPILGVNQLVGSSGLMGQAVAQGANQNVQDADKAFEGARAQVGDTGFDTYRMAGAVASPVNKVAGAINAPLAVVKGITPAIIRSGGTGAVLGAVQPVTGEDYVGNKLEQIAIGGILGPVFEGGINGAGQLIGALKNLTPAGRRAVMVRELDKLVGPQRDKVIGTLRDAREVVSGSRPTVAEVLSDIPSAVELMAAQKKLASKPGVGAKFVVRTSENQAARVRALEGISGTEAERAAAKVTRDEVTGVMRETALNQSDVAAPLTSRLEKEVASKFNSMVAADETAINMGKASALQGAKRAEGKPGWLTAGDLSVEAAGRAKLYQGRSADLRSEGKFAQFQLNSLEQNGFFPLHVRDVTDSLDAAIKGSSSDQSKAVLRALKDKVLSKADENGVLSSRDLYENVRKTSNQDINKLLGLGEQYASGGIPTQAAKALVEAKKIIDASLDSSSNGLWSKYLTTYSEHSQKMDRMNVGDFLVRQLKAPLDKERAGVFAAAVENAHATIKKSTGIPRYNKLSDVLTPQEVATVNSVRADVMRSSKADELASKISGMDAGPENIAAMAPGVLSRTVLVVRSVLEHLYKGNVKEFNAKMGELMLDPAAMATFLTHSVKKGKINDFVSSLYKVMDPATAAAFKQSFVIPSTSQAIGQQ